MNFEKKTVLLLLGVNLMTYEFGNIIVGIPRERKIKLLTPISHTWIIFLANITCNYYIIFLVHDSVL